MSEQLDLNLIPTARYAGQERPDLLGLYVAQSPRRPARGRGNDRLVLYLAVTGNAPLPPGKRDTILEDLAKLYFSTPGSVTSAMRAVADALNNMLLERNLRLTHSSRQGIGVLTQLVLRSKNLYLSLSGPAHVFLISSGQTQQYYDPAMSNRGLGQGRTPPVAYYQTRLQSNDTVVLSALPAPEWNTTTLAGYYGQGPESLRRKLFHQTLMDVNAVLIHARLGRGRFYLPPSVPSRQERPAIEDQPPAVQGTPQPVAQSALQEQINDPVMESARRDAGVETDAAVRQVASELEAVSGGSGTDLTPHEEAFASTGGPAARRTRLPAWPKPDFSVLWRFLAAVGVPLVKVFQRIGNAFDTFMSRLLPGDMPATTLAFIALAVPVIVVTMAYWTYRRLGETTLLAEIYTQAHEQAVVAVGQADLLAQRAEWEQVLVILQQAVEYGSTPQIDALRGEARHALDDLDMVRRVNFQPVFSEPLPDTVRIVRLVSVDNDLYLLDGESGNVIRALPTNQGYVIDNGFQCGPGPVGVTDLGPLIDILPWPHGYQPAATILALEAGGRLVYCQPDMPAQQQILGQPTVPLGKLTGFTIDLVDLYVLDPDSNAIWLYAGNDYEGTPRFIFGDQVPDLIGVNDLVINRDQLYLLNLDGSITLCDVSLLEGAPTRCAKQPYIDFRPGRENTQLVTTNPFSQILFSPPPDPSLFLLEPQSHAIYHFSLRTLTFQRQYLSLEPLSPRPATAFFVDPIMRNIFLAIGNQIYFASLP